MEQSAKHKKENTLPYAMYLMKNFFLSLKTTVWLLFALVCLFFVGSYMLPSYRNIFTPMNDLLLIDWIRIVALDTPLATWWFFVSLAVLVLLTINTCACSIRAVTGRWSKADFVLRIAPQVVHIGFLFILLGHLLGAGWGYKVSGTMREGTFARLPENRALYLRAIHAESDDRGFLKDWSAQVVLYENKSEVAAGSLGPNRPLFYNGTGIYLKSFQMRQPQSIAMLLVAKDPGALWALLGGILFIIGSVAVLIFKWKIRYASRSESPGAN